MSNLSPQRHTLWYGTQIQRHIDHQFSANHSLVLVLFSFSSVQYQSMAQIFSSSLSMLKMSKMSWEQLAKTKPKVSYSTHYSNFIQCCPCNTIVNADWQEKHRTILLCRLSQGGSDQILRQSSLCSKSRKPGRRTLYCNEAARNSDSWYQESAGTGTSCCDHANL